jgi:hypothetical protein
MPKIQRRSDERPSKLSSPLSTPSQASCTTSSATARLETNVEATRSIEGCSRWTMARNAFSSPARSAAIVRCSSEPSVAAVRPASMQPPDSVAP